MHKTGHYKKLNLVFGAFPFVAAILLERMTPQSNVFTQWFSIVSTAARYCSPAIHFA